VSIAICYATRYGSTREVAERLAGRLAGDVRLYDLADRAPVNLSEVSAVVIGSPVFSGRVPAAVRRFIAGAREELAEREVILYMTSLYSGARAEAQLADNYPAWLVAHCRAKHFVGGRIRLSGLRRLDSFVLRRVGLVSEDIDTISDSSIDELVSSIEQVSIG